MSEPTSWPTRAECAEIDKLRRDHEITKEQIETLVAWCTLSATDERLSEPILLLIADYTSSKRTNAAYQGAMELVKQQHESALRFGRCCCEFQLCEIAQRIRAYESGVTL